MAKKYECPVCLTSKKYYVGNKYKDCKTCDDEGMVDEETYDLHTNNEEFN